MALYITQLAWAVLATHYWLSGSLRRAGARPRRAPTDNLKTKSARGQGQLALEFCLLHTGAWRCGYPADPRT